MAQSPSDGGRSGLSRRTFLKGAGGVTAGGLVVGQPLAQPPPTGPARRAGRAQVVLRVNGERREVQVEPRTTLLDALRVHASPPLTGSKLVCDRGTCGACTVLLEGRPVYACLQLAVDCEGREVTTVEGLAPSGELSPVQRAFVSRDASMCGFCTPGFVVSVSACLARDPRASEADIRRACAGNLCRCGTYPQVFEAALEAGRELAARGGGR